LVFAREQGAGYYSLAAYFFSKIMVEIPFQIIFPWLGATIIYFMAGFPNDVEIYFIFVAFVVLSGVGDICLIMVDLRILAWYFLCLDIQGFTNCASDRPPLASSHDVIQWTFHQFREYPGLL
jgi:hypothetical protein